MNEINIAADTDDYLEQTEIVSFNLSEDARLIARSLSRDKDGIHGSEDKPFETMRDAIRFAITLGIYKCKNNTPPQSQKSGVKISTLSEIDPNDGTFRKALDLLVPDLLNQEGLSRLLRRYAEFGLLEMQQQYERGDGHFEIDVVIADTITS